MKNTGNNEFHFRTFCYTAQIIQLKFGKLFFVETTRTFNNDAAEQNNLSELRSFLSTRGGGQR